MYFFRSTSPTTSKTSGEQKDAKASSRDRDEGTSQPSPRWEEVETVRRHYLAFGCSGGVEVVDAICFWIVFVASITYCPVCVFVSWLDVFRLVGDRHLGCTPFLSLSMAYCWCLDLFFDFLGTPSISIHQCHWVVQIPGREKSSKWKYKDDEGGKKDAEKEKTRSREQEWSMNHSTVWMSGSSIAGCDWTISKILIMFFLFILRLATALLFQEH